MSARGLVEHALDGAAAAEIFGRNWVAADRLKRHRRDGGGEAETLLVEIAQRLGLDGKFLGQIERQMAHRILLPKTPCTAHRMERANKCARAGSKPCHADTESWE